MSKEAQSFLFKVREALAQREKDRHEDPFYWRRQRRIIVQLGLAGGALAVGGAAVFLWVLRELEKGSTQPELVDLESLAAVGLILGDLKKTSNEDLMELNPRIIKFWEEARGNNQTTGANKSLFELRITNGPLPEGRLSDQDDVRPVGLGEKTVVSIYWQGDPFADRGKLFPKLIQAMLIYERYKNSLSRGGASDFWKTEISYRGPSHTNTAEMNFISRLTEEYSRQLEK